jgi:hypothetical protein
MSVHLTAANTTQDSANIQGSHDEISISDWRVQQENSSRNQLALDTSEFQCSKLGRSKDNGKRSYCSEDFNLVVDHLKFGIVFT